MDIKEILVTDTGGQLAEDIFKIDPSLGVTRVWFGNKDTKKPILASVGNIRYSAIPGIEGSTYKMYLTYNGSAGRTGKVYSTVVAEAQGIFNSASLPVLEFSTGVFYDKYVDGTKDVDDVVFDLGQFRKCEVLQYDKTCCGGSTSRTMYTREYSLPLEYFPNTHGTAVYTDGWYTLTFIILRDINSGDRVNKGLFYGFNGFIFKASDDGVLVAQKFTECGGSENDFYVKEKHDDCGGCGDCEGEDKEEATPNLSIQIIVDGTANVVAQTYDDNYLDMLFDLNNSAGRGAQAGSVYVQSQILISVDLLKNMTTEVAKFGEEHCTGSCDFADWQDLMLKGIAARVMFSNGAYSNAQTIIEGSRELCDCNGDYGVGC